MDIDLREWASEATREVPIFEMVASELPTIAGIAKAPLRRHHMFRTMLKLAEGTRMTDLMETMKPVTRRTIENDLAYFKQAGVLRSQPGKKTVGKWGHRLPERKAGRPSMTYSLVNPQDLITSDLAYQLVASPEFKRLLEREVLAAVEFVKIPPPIMEAIRPFRKIPELNPLFRNLPPSDEIHIDYSLLDTISPGEFINLALVRVKASIPGEF